MICLILRTEMAYCITDRQFMSVCTTRLATLRCTKSSPGSRPTISLAGTRLSEQPIHRYCGACWPSSRRKNPGSAEIIRAAQARLFAFKCSSMDMARGALRATGSAHHQRGVLALAIGEAARPHPVIGAAEQRGIVIVDMLVAHEGAQKLARLQGALGVRRDVVGVFVEIAVDAVDRLVLGVIIGFALLG